MLHIPLSDSTRPRVVLSRHFPLVGEAYSSVPRLSFSEARNSGPGVGLSCRRLGGSPDPSGPHASEFSFFSFLNVPGRLHVFAETRLRVPVEFFTKFGLYRGCFPIGRFTGRDGALALPRPFVARHVASFHSPPRPSPLGAGGRLEASNYESYLVRPYDGSARLRALLCGGGRGPPAMAHLMVGGRDGGWERVAVR